MAEASAPLQDARRSRSASTVLVRSMAYCRGRRPQRRRDPAGDVADRLVDVGHDAPAVHRDPGTHHAPGFDHLGSGQSRVPGRGDEDVGLLRRRRQIGDARVHDGDRGVGVLFLQREE